MALEQQRTYSLLLFFFCLLERYLRLEAPGLPASGMQDPEFVSMQAQPVRGAIRFSMCIEVTAKNRVIDMRQMNS